jgi:hypothetical protein
VWYSDPSGEINVDGPSHQDPILVEEMFTLMGKPDFVDGPS